MITAKELIKQEAEKGNYHTTESIMIEFAKLHVTEALKQASDKLRLTEDQYVSDYHDEKRRILNAYNLYEIK